MTGQTSGQVAELCVFLEHRNAELETRIVELENEKTMDWWTKPDTQCVTDGCDRPAVLCTQHMMQLQARIEELEAALKNIASATIYAGTVTMPMYTETMNLQDIARRALGVG